MANASGHVGRWVAALAVSLMLATAAGAQGTAATFPSKSVRLIVPAAAGGGLDLLARVLGAKLAELWSQPVIVENRPGAAFMVGAEAAARSPADGYTLLFVSSGAITIAPALMSDLRFNPRTDLVPVTITSLNPFLLVVNNDVPAKNLAEFLAYVRSQPGKINHASNSSTTVLLASELLKSLASIEYTDVNYRGAPQAVTAVMTGEAQFLLIDTPSVGSALRAGKVRALAVSTLKRYSLEPGIPTMSESGVLGYEAVPYGVLMVPAKTPADVVRKINVDVLRALSQTDSIARFNAYGSEVVGTSEAESARLLNEDADKWARLVKARNISIK